MSSIATIEVVSLDVPVLVIDDFGVGPELISTVFADSGLFGGSCDLVEGRFRLANAGWSGDNHFHAPWSSDWIGPLTKVLALRDAGGCRSHRCAGWFSVRRRSRPRCRPPR